jgi:hypothetical protein
LREHAVQEKLLLEQRIQVLETDNRHLQATAQQITEESDMVIHRMSQELSHLRSLVFPHA